jgi:hypothetical protein
VHDRFPLAGNDRACGHTARAWSTNALYFNPTGDNLMKFLSKAPMKSFAAAVVAFMVLAIPAQADDIGCMNTCSAAATQASNSARSSATQQAATSCGQNAHSQQEFNSCMSAAQPYIDQAAQTAYNSAYSSCMGQCRAYSYSYY